MRKDWKISEPLGDTRQAMYVECRLSQCAAKLVLQAWERAPGKIGHVAYNLAKPSGLYGRVAVTLRETVTMLCKNQQTHFVCNLLFSFNETGLQLA